MQTVNLKVKRATVVMGVSAGPDRISLELDLASPFPAMGYASYATIETQKGHGADYCRSVLGVVPDEVIDARQTRQQFTELKKKVEDARRH